MQLADAGIGLFGCHLLLPGGALWVLEGKGNRISSSEHVRPHQAFLLCGLTQGALEQEEIRAEKGISIRVQVESRRLGKLRLQQKSGARERKWGCSGGGRGKREVEKKWRKEMRRETKEEEDGGSWGRKVEEGKKERGERRETEKME